MHVGQGGDAEHQSLGAARDAGQAAGQHEGDQLVVVGAIAERGRAWLVLADALQHLAEGGMDDAVDHQEPAQEDGGDDPVHGHVVGQVDEAEQVAARHLLDAVLAAGEGGLQAEEIHHLRQRQGDHGEIDAGPADRQVAEHEAERRPGQPPQGDGDGGVEVPGLHGPGGDIAAHAEIGGVAEGQQPDIADHQVEGAGEQRRAQDPHQEHGVQHEGRDHDQRQHDQEGNELGAGETHHVRRPFRTGPWASSTG